MKKIFFIVLIVLLILSVVACDESENAIINDEIITENKSQETIDKILVGVMTDYNPYIDSDNSDVSGPYVEVVTKVLENLGYEYELVNLPWSRLLSAVETGAVDLAFPFFDKVDRRAFLYYEEEPIGFSQISVIGLLNTKAKYKGDLTSLSGYRVGVVQDYFYSKEFEKAVDNGVISTDQAISTYTNIEKLLQGRVDLIIEDPEVVKEYIRINNINQELVYFEQAITSDYNYLVFTKNKNLSQLRHDVNQEMKRIKSDNTLYNIFSDYNMQYYGDLFKSVEASNPPPEKFFQDYSNTPITIGILGNTKPYAYYENEKLVGFNIDFMSEILNRIGVEYEFIDLPFSRMLEELKSGSLDIGTDIYLNPDRQEYAQYPTLPFAAYPTVIFKKSNTEFNFTGDPEELKPYSIGYIRDYSLGPIDEYKSDDEYNFVVTDSPEQNMENLVNGRVDLIIDIKSTGESLIAKMDLVGEVIQVNPVIQYDYSYIVFSKKNDLGKLTSEYEKTVLRMFEDGTIESLSKKYNLPYLKLEDLKQ